MTNFKILGWNFNPPDTSSAENARLAAEDMTSDADTFAGMSLGGWNSDLSGEGGRSLDNSARIFKETQFALAAAFLEEDPGTIDRAVGDVRILSEVTKAIGYKDAFLIYSASSVRVGHVRLQLSEYTVSSDSFTPVEALNDTIIAREFSELKAKDPKRAEALERYVKMAYAVEDYLNQGLWSTEFKTSGELSPSAGLRDILATLKELEEEARPEEFADVLAAAEAELAERGRLEAEESARWPGSEEYKLNKGSVAGKDVVFFGGAVDWLGKLSHTVDKVSLLEVLRRKAIEGLEEEQEKM